MGSADDLRGPVARSRILIVDDHSLIRRGLTGLIDGEPDLVVCAAVGTQLECLAALEATRPDLVIADLSLGGGNGLALVEDIRSRDADLPVLVLTIHEASIYAERAGRAGASGYLNKQEMDGTLLLTIRRLLESGHVPSPRES